LPYLRELRKDGIEVTIMTFEPGWPSNWTEDEISAWKSRLLGDGIGWQAVRYHKRPSLIATLYDVAAGVLRILRLPKNTRPEILHARSHVAALMGAIAKRLIGARLIFDIRGFMPEEYVDAGVWKSGGLTYRLTKRVERWLLGEADGFVVLTEKAKGILFPGAGERDERGRPIEVIPCCADLSRFGQTETGEVRGIERVWVYVGALGGWYLTGEMAEFLAFLTRKRENDRALILTQSPSVVLSDALDRADCPRTKYDIRKAKPDEVPGYLRSADIGISFIKPCYSKLSSSPTKVGEYLAAGLPVLSNSGIGDLDELIAGEGVGVIIRGFDEADYEEALAGMDRLLADPRIRDRCIGTARRYFDLETVGGERYSRLYRRLASQVQ